jgi:hypothetical protein
MPSVAHDVARRAFNVEADRERGLFSDEPAHWPRTVTEHFMERCTKDAIENVVVASVRGRMNARFADNKINRNQLFVTRQH